MQILFSLDVAEFLDGCLPLAAFFHAFMTVCDRHHPHKTSAALHYSSPFSFLKSKTSISKHFSKKKSFAVQYHSVYCIKTLKKSQFTKKNRIFAHHSTTHFYPIFGTLANANIMRQFGVIFKHCDINAVFSVLKDFCSRDLFTQQ